VVAAGAAAALLAAFLIPDGGIEDGPIICPFRRLTGLPCPGCGLTRAWVHLAHGQWQESFLAHPFGIVSVLLAVALVALVVARRLRGRRPPELDALVLKPWLLGLLALWMAFAVVRLAIAL